MIATVCKIFTFDSAHRLRCHAGKCKNVHGHTYKLEVHVQGHIQEVPTGMVIDFGDLKKIVNELIINNFDHALILGINDMDDELIKALKTKRHLVNYEPTAENMARDIFKIINDRLIDEGFKCRVSKIRLWETPTSFAEVT